MFNYSKTIRKEFKTSTCPYLSEKTGRFFKNFDEFNDLLLAWKSGSLIFDSRRWVVENMSDEVSARRLCQLAGIKY